MSLNQYTYKEVSENYHSIAKVYKPDKKDPNNKGKNQKPLASFVQVCGDVLNPQLAKHQTTTIYQALSCFLYSKKYRTIGKNSDSFTLKLELADIKTLQKRTT